MRIEPTSRHSQFSSSMKPQARAFSVETKSPKRRTTAAMARRDDWLDITPPDDLSDGHLPDDGSIQSQARRQAEEVFGRPGGVSTSAEEPSDAASPVTSLPQAAPSPRVLPDLLSAAPEQQSRPVQEPKRERARKGTKPKSTSKGANPKRTSKGTRPKSAPESRKSKRPKRKADQPLE